MKIRFLSLLIGTLFTFIVDAQDIEVKKFEPLEKDQTTALSPRKDINGNDCALVLVRTLKKGMEFDGWVVGDVEYKDDSYWVYMANGAKHINIKHPDYQTKKVLFSEYGIGNVKGGQLYSLCIVDETKDIINKVYSLGWNLSGFEVSERAKTFLNMSAKRGDKKAIIALAQLSVGGNVQKGEFLEQNKGLYWIESLLEKGDSACLDSMPGELMHVYACKIIRDGISHDRSANRVDTYKERSIYTAASKYDLKACQKGYKEAGDDFFLDYIQSNGLPAYKKEVMRLCLDSASTGNTKAMRCLGVIFENGICEEANLLTASKWYRKIYDSSLSNQSKTDLCRVYGNCRFTIDEESLKFIKHQADEGLQEALFQLGCMYEEGRNVEKNVEKAIELYKQSKPTIFDSNRHQGATYRLAKIYYDRKDYKEAENLLRGLYDDELDARYLQAMILFQDTRNYKVDAYNILSDLSKKGYQKATEFIKNNY
jgi:TPR repeat protein